MDSAFPDVNAPTQEERIQARRRRIEQRLLRKKQKKEGKHEEAERNLQRKKQTTEEAWDSQANAQQAVARATIDDAVLASQDAVTEVRVESNFMQSEYRFLQKQKSRARADDLDALARGNAESNAAISLNWAGLLEKDIPQDLLHGIMEQKRRCDDVIATKDTVIASFTAELEAKDEEYVAELKRQSEQIDSLVERMGEQFKTLQHTYERELQSLEATFEGELSSLHDHNTEAVKALIDKRAALEHDHMTQRLDLLKTNQDEIEDLQRQQGEGLNIVTIQLQTSVQILRQQLEEMRATYALNSQKLEYNIKILDRREFENGVTISQQKRKINSLGDQVAALRSRYEKQDKQYRYENQKLTNDYRRITDQYKELQRKFRHFQLADAEKFKKVWDMNEEIVAELIGKTLQADKIIHEQQLGLDWQPPTQDVFSIRQANLPIDDQGRPITVPSNAPATPATADHTATRNAPLIDPTAAADPLAVNEAAAPATPAHPGDAGSRPPTAADGAPVSVLAQGSPDLARRILDMLCDEAGFLIEEKVHSLLEPLDRDEQNLLMVNSIFKALKIESRQEVDKLLSYFVADPNQLMYLSQLREEDSSDGSEYDTALQRETVRTVDPNQVIHSLRRFVQDHNRDLDISRQSTKQSTSIRFMKEEKERSRAQERNYWQQLGNIVSDRTYRVWDALFNAMTQYHGVLEERAKLLDETDAIRQQNTELKMLLNQYLGMQVNDELHVPPIFTDAFTGGHNDH